MRLYTEDYSYTSETKKVMDIIQTPIMNLVNWEFDNIKTGHCSQVQGVTDIYYIIRKAIMHEPLSKGHTDSAQVKEIYTTFHELIHEGYLEDFIYCVALEEAVMAITRTIIHKQLSAGGTFYRGELIKASK